MAALIQFASGAPGVKYSVDKRNFFIGRNAQDNDICLPCAFVSKRHALIEVVDNLLGNGFDYYLEDLGSTNHTYVNDEPVRRVRLENGDIIRIGRSTFKFDSTAQVPVVIAEEIEIKEPEFTTASYVPPAGSSQSATLNFSRRLRTIGVES